MKKVILIVLVVVVGLVVVSKLGGEKEKGTTRNDAPDSAVVGRENEGGTGNEVSANGNNAALELIKQEPKVKEAIITDVNVLYVSVVDDGTNRDGYASYLCEILREKKAAAKRVKVVKVNSTNDPNRDNAYGVLLGESYCN